MRFGIGGNAVKLSLLALTVLVALAFVSIVQAQNTYSVTVQVVNGTQPLSACLVQLSGQTEYSGVTDANGTAAFNVTEGKYLLSTDARGEVKAQVVTVNGNVTFVVDYAEAETEVPDVPQNEDSNSTEPDLTEPAPPYPESEEPSPITTVVVGGIMFFLVFCLLAFTVLMPKKENPREAWKNRRRY